MAEDCISVIDLDSVEDGDDGSSCDDDDGISIMFEDCDSVSNDDIGCDGYGSDGVGDAECDDGGGGHDGAGEDGEEDNFTDVNDSVRANVPVSWFYLFQVQCMFFVLLMHMFVCATSL